MDKIRASGILLHPTSLPGKYGIGQLGGECREFIDFLGETGQKLWQILPLNPTGYTNCPYSSISAFAGNPYLISYDELISDKLLTSDDLPECTGFSDDRVDFGKVYETVFSVLKKAFYNFLDRKDKIEDYNKFCQDEHYWLDDYALFSAIKDSMGGNPWFEWPENVRIREKDTILTLRKTLKDDIEFHKFIQYIFFRQWMKIKEYANLKGVKIISDIPLYIAHDSADVWAHPEIFQMDVSLSPSAQAGVPPDYFSSTGQLWGNPVYNWDELKRSGYEWWIERIKINKEISDILRFDHFRGFSEFWAVPWDHETAVYGEWKKAFGDELFNAVRKEFGDVTMIAEDLGIITDDVKELRDKYGFVGMKILQFGFDSGEDNEFLPHTYHSHSIVYTGSLDNDTVKGWHDKASQDDRNFFDDYVVREYGAPSWDLIRSAWSSVSCFAMTTMQDILENGNSARMNTPGTTFGNWEWRYKNTEITADYKNRLRKITETYKRI